MKIFFVFYISVYMHMDIILSTVKV